MRKTMPLFCLFLIILLTNTACTTIKPVQSQSYSNTTAPNQKDINLAKPSAPIISIANPAPPRSLEEMYERAKPSGPPGDLSLDLFAFPYCGLSNLRNSNNPDADVQLLEKFPYLVCAEPGRLTTEEKAIANILKDKTRIFGYIYLGNKSISLNILKNEIDSIAEAKWYGVFIDQFGYDFNETRTRQNEIVDYVHSKGLSCFVNAWFIDDALGNEIDPEHNPTGEPSLLGKGDWYLLESFLMNNGGYTDWEASWNKYLKGNKYKEELGVNIVALSYKPSTMSWENALLDIRKSYMIALTLGFDGWWYSDRLEDINFLFGHVPELNLGNSMLKTMHETSPNNYVAETDLYYLVFNTNTYPPIRYIIYDKNRKKDTM
ncbi:MAG: hypothetical protein CVU87_02275 [Firmicutes bacterium HGW-Firmicutes-12]|jgi:hypothetical protein|nr:MAG: hypothetical protein CVU87_02275 [Firmicutes bacterium HGW-Firmicutes-12]